MCAEKHTMATGILGTLIFIRMAKRAPMHHKLYRELVLSYVYGGVIGYAWSHYYWMQYINVVNESYEFVKQRFAANPELLKNVDDHDKSISVNKNFGLS